MLIQCVLIILLISVILLYYGNNLSEKYNGPLNTACIVCCIKDEDEFIVEWIDYHLRIGFNKIYLYDNDNSVNTQKLIETYVQNETVIYTPMTNAVGSISIISKMFKHFKKNYQQNSTGWICHVDADEFINLKNYSKIQDFLKEYSMYGTIQLKRYNFGTSGYIKLTGKILDKLIHMNPEEPVGDKCISSNKNLINLGIHKHEVSGNRAYPDKNEINIHHYCSRGAADYLSTDIRRLIDLSNDKYIILMKNNCNNYYDLDDKTFCYNEFMKLKNSKKRLGNGAIHNGFQNKSGGVFIRWSDKNFIVDKSLVGK